MRYCIVLCVSRKRVGSQPPNNEVAVTSEQ